MQEKKFNPAPLLGLIPPAAVLAAEGNKLIKPDDHGMVPTHDMGINQVSHPSASVPGLGVGQISHPSARDLQDDHMSGLSSENLKGYPFAPPPRLGAEYGSPASSAPSGMGQVGHPSTMPPGMGMGQVGHPSATPPGMGIGQVGHPSTTPPGMGMGQVNHPSATAQLPSTQYSPPTHNASSPAQYSPPTHNASSPAQYSPPTHNVQPPTQYSPPPTHQVLSHAQYSPPPTHQVLSHTQYSPPPTHYVPSATHQIVQGGVRAAASAVKTTSLLKTVIMPLILVVTVGTASTVALLAINHRLPFFNSADSAPADNATFRLNVSAQGQYDQGNGPITSSGVLLINQGNVCASMDTGQSQQSNGTLQSGDPYTQTASLTCSGTYKEGQIDYTETLASATIVMTDQGTQYTCTLSSPVSLEHLTGSYTEKGKFSGTFTISSIPQSAFSCPPNATYMIEGGKGTWAGTVSS